MEVIKTYIVNRYGILVPMYACLKPKEFLTSNEKITKDPLFWSEQKIAWFIADEFTSDTQSSTTRLVRLTRAQAIELVEYDYPEIN